MVGLLVVWCACLALAGTTATCDGETAGGRPCVPKCCPVGQTISEDDGSCQPSDLEFRPYFEPEEGDYDYDDGGVATAPPLLLDHNNSYIIVGDPCKYKKFRLEPYANNADEFYLLRNGTLWAPGMYPGRSLGPADYCLDTFYVYSEATREGFQVVLPLLCFEAPSDDDAAASYMFVLYPVGLLISVPFLVATMLVYCVLPELRNLRGKTLSCHVMCLAVAYVLLAAVQLGGAGFSERACVSLAFMIQFAFQACFFWLQVMCFDTWWIVRSTYNTKKAQLEESDEENDPDGSGVVNEGFDSVDSSKSVTTVCCFPELVDGGKVPSKRTERKVFLCYSLYAWTCSIILIVVSLTTDLIPTIPSSYIKPNIGLNKCWFNSQEAELNYFYGPVIFILVTNLIMFIHTSYMIWRINRWNHPGKNEKRCFLLCFSLFFVMGINWILEVISWAAGGPPYIWHVTDFINTLQGVIIFGIFVLEPYVRSLVHQRLWPRISKVLCKCHERSDSIHTQSTARTVRPSILYSSVVTRLQPKATV